VTSPQNPVTGSRPDKYGTGDGSIARMHQLMPDRPGDRDQQQAAEVLALICGGGDELHDLHTRYCVPLAEYLPGALAAARREEREAARAAADRLRERIRTLIVRAGIVRSHLVSVADLREALEET
jgi:hypothetical protein